MPAINSTKTESTELPSRISSHHRFFRVFMGRKVVIFGSIIILVLLLTAILAPVIAPYDPYKMDLRQALLQPCKAHILGTDPLGRDTLSRIIYGTRISLMVGIVSVAIAASLGMTMGLIAGYFGGFIYTIIMRFVDTLMSFPMLLLAIIISGVIGSGLKSVIIALGITLMSVYARLMCGQVLGVKETDYITASRVIGGSNLRIMLRHILPNCFPPLIVLMTMQLGAAILVEAGLSFLGIGIEPPVAAWGGMVSDGYRFLLKNPILSLAPGLAIMMVVFAFNMVGDGLRDALDPRLRGTI